MASSQTPYDWIVDRTDANRDEMDQIEFCDDIFDVDDDEYDENDSPETVNHQYLHHFDFERLHMSMNDEVTQKASESQWNSSLSTCEQENLSQELSQLSTEEGLSQRNQSTQGKKRSHSSTPSTPNVLVKKNRCDDAPLIDKDGTLPEYLQSNNALFRYMLYKHIFKLNSSLTLAEIQSFAMLKHRLASIKLDHSLWNVYLAVGTGEWPLHGGTIITMDRRFWPTCVKQMITADQLINDESLNNSYEKRVREKLATLASTMYEYEEILRNRRTEFIHASVEVEDCIDQYVQNYGIRPLQIYVDHQIKKLELDRDIDMHDREHSKVPLAESQLTNMKRIYDLKFEELKAKQVVREIKQRILCDRPRDKTLQSSIQASSIATISENIDEKNRLRALDRYEKSIQEEKTARVSALLMHMERRVQQSEDAFSQAMVEINLSDDTSKDGSMENIRQFIDRRLDLYQKKMDCIDQYRFTYILRNRYDTSLFEREKERFRQYSPSLIIDTASHQLTFEQMQLLSRGPSYVPPCYLYMTPVPTKQLTHERFLDFYAPFKHQLTIVFAKYATNMAQAMFLQQELFRAFQHAFSVFLPKPLYQRALYEKQLVCAIRNQLHEQQYILRRTADQRNVFYLGDRVQFEGQARQYMLLTDRFEFYEKADLRHPELVQDLFKQCVKNINQELQRLFAGHKLQKDLLTKLEADINKITLPYLYFLPDVSEISMTLVPIVVAKQTITSRIGQYLEKLLRPIIDRSIQSTVFPDGAHFMRKLYHYGYTERRLRSDTIFVSIKILDFTTIATHANILIQLEAFLLDNLVTPCIENIALKKFLDLTRLFLRNNLFYYEGDLYRFVKGGPDDWPIFDTLSTIFIYHWQKRLVQELSLHNEFFGRCRDRLFFTWNRTSDDLQVRLDHIRQRVPDVRFDWKMGFTVDFLQAYVENRKSVLYTRVYRDPKAQKYTLPYVNQHAKIEHSHWVRSSLIQAVRYCTSVDDFNQERIYLEMTLLANGYTLEFVERRINHFFHHFNATSLRRVQDQQAYNRLRHQMFNFLSEQNRQLNAEEEAKNKKLYVQIQYPYQYGSREAFEKQCRQLLSNHFSARLKIPSNRMNIVLMAQQPYSLNALLSQQKPCHHIFDKRIING